VLTPGCHFRVGSTAEAVPPLAWKAAARVLKIAR
jgi:hypothetical protein